MHAGPNRRSLARTLITSRNGPDLLKVMGHVDVFGPGYMCRSTSDDSSEICSLFKRAASSPIEINNVDPECISQSDNIP